MFSVPRRAVLTGIGVINPLGMNAAAFWESLSRGRCGIRTIQAFDPSALPCRLGGEVLGFDAKNFIDKKDRKSLRVMARGIQMAVAAAQLAMEDSRINKDQLDPTRFGIEFGAGLLSTELDELGAASHASVNCQSELVDFEKWGEQGIPCIPPLWMLKYLPNMLACQVSILQNAQGPNNTITEGDVASLLALGEAYHIIQRRQADLFLVGGADSRTNPLSMVRQCLFSQLSRRHEAPEKSVRPFERNRDGCVIGEGSAVLVLEDLDLALGRQARIYAEMVGFVSGFDRSCTGQGLARVLRLALDQAGIGPEDVDHVNAHGLGTPQADAWEAQAIALVFGSRRRPVPVFAAKSYFGNLGAGSGISELVASLLALEHGLVPATLNYEEPDPACPVSVIRKPQPLRKKHVLKIGFTDLGQIGVGVFRKWDR